MDLTKVLEQLRAELANLNAAIVSLEKLQKEGPRRGRPPKLLTRIKRGEHLHPKDQADDEEPED
jgi:hypothetical protein